MTDDGEWCPLCAHYSIFKRELDGRTVMMCRGCKEYNVIEPENPGPSVPNLNGK